MPDARLQRTRDAYDCEMCGGDLLVGRHVREFDAYGLMREDCPTRLHVVFQSTAWRAPHENAAEQLTRHGITANVIEGDHS